jgi:sugar phosphate isomerase/epimerase
VNEHLDGSLEVAGRDRAAAPSRRRFLKVSGVAALAGAGGIWSRAAGEQPAAEKAAADHRAEGTLRPQALKLGLVTYNLAKDWDLKTIIKNCTECKFEAVELRTSHAHGVELSLSPAQRKDVRSLFQGSRVVLASLGSTYEFHSPDPAQLRKNIDGAKEYAKLAADVGASGIKVRPNGLPKQVPAETTLRQIGESLAVVAAEAAKVGVQVRVEVHGSETSRLPNMKKILDFARHENVYACWNSNDSDLEGGGLEANFALVKEKIGFVHMRDLCLENYPFRKLLKLLRDSGYKGYCCAEIGESSDPIRVMRYYRALFLAYQDLL